MRNFKENIIIFIVALFITLLFALAPDGNNGHVAPKGQTFTCNECGKDVEMALDATIDGKDMLVCDMCFSRLFD